MGWSLEDCFFDAFSNELKCMLKRHVECVILAYSAVTFLLPYGLLTAELGSTFTKEGGVYEWCKLAGGRFYAALTAMLYWISNPLWIAGTLSVGAIAAIKTFWFGSTNYRFGGSKLSDALIEMAIALLGRF